MRIAFLIIIFSLSANAEEREYSTKVELGDGFTKQKYTMQNPPDHWEAIAHYSTTFYKDLELGMLDGLYISPAKDYALYNKAKEGKLYLLELASKSEKAVKFESYCFPYDPQWKAGDVTINCIGKAESKFLLKIDLTSQSTTRLSAPDSQTYGSAAGY
ncbi:hypothetical protein WCN91_14530 [Pseudoalteromonas sp. YIC-827]|uniref:Uncharacterized protein n=1 Tax=Pseudoalteromonas qingdaonensis TaxID=3131913 RepID=A0ABU9MZG8_9GAMM